MSKLKDYLLPAIPVVIGLLLFTYLVKPAADKVMPKTV